MNMKPSWDDAPEWAQWLAMDEDGRWWWYEEKPVLQTNYFYWLGSKMEESLPVLDRSMPWDKSLEKRKSPSSMNIDKIARMFHTYAINDHEDAENLRIEAEAFARKVAALVEALHNLEDERVTAVLAAHEVSI